MCKYKVFDQHIQDLATGTQYQEQCIFDELANYYYEHLLKAAQAVLRSRSDAEETVQDTLLRAYHALPYFRNDSHIFTWLYRIVINQAKSRKRQNDHKIQNIGLKKILNINLISSERSCVCSPVYLPFYHLCRREIAELLLKEISRLPANMRKTAYLRYIKSFSYQQIARKMNCSVGTVKSRMARARKILQKKLAPYRYDFYILQ